ncbi:MAG: transketolase family protein [Oscillospiraceae bacterium]|nr:transketolase family protein [Oscillospiraceae bacterium]
MADKIATRNAYGEALAELGEKYPQLVVLDADLSGATMSKFFAAKYPDRFFDCGIAEANMTVIAAGMATCGLKPFTNTFAIFAAGRAYEQVRNSIAYPGLNVTVVGSHGGVSVGEDGATHQCIEDFSLMRTIPGMLVCCPCDGNEMRQAVEALINYNGPAYLRLERPATEIVTDSLDGYRFELGKGVTMRDGGDVSIIANGIMVPVALKAADLLNAEGISARVIDMHTIKPLDEELVLKAAKETGCIVTSEEHSVIGGLGAAVCEFLSGTYPVPVVRHGVNDQFGRSGSANAVLEYFGLTPEVLAEKARSAIALKK